MVYRGRMRNLVIGLAALVLCEGAMAAEANLVSVEPLAANEASPTWQGPQFIQADKQGRVFVLDGEMLRLFQFVEGDKLVARGRLEAAGSVESGEPPVVRRAAMSPAGDMWLLLDSDRKVRMFRSGKEKYLPQPGWIVSDMAAPRGNPLLAVAPGEVAHGREVGSTEQPKGRLAPPPFLLDFGDSEWETLVEGDFFKLGDTRASIGREIRAGSALWISTEPDGTIWVAFRNAYRLKRYSPLGKLKDEIVVGDGQVKWAERSEEDWKKLEAIAKENKYPFRRSGVSPVQETAVVRAMTVGRDGRVYLLTETPKGLALDRFDPDPARQVLERILLSGIGSGRYSMAAGRHALYIAAQLGNGGRWRLPWEILDTAKWELVEGTVVNGQPTKVADTPAK